VTAAVRRPASPYARRLARDRGLGLELITGSGPGGWIVAADVEAFVASRAAGAASPAVAASAVSVFGVSVDLGALDQLLAGLEAAGNTLTLEDMLVRAGGLALAALPEGGDPVVVVLETAERGAIPIEDPQRGLVSALHARLAEESAAGTAENGKPALLSVRCFRIAGIRAVAMPLMSGVPLRLIVSAAAGGSAAGNSAECLLSFDAGRFAEETAAELLGRIRDDLELPLRLLA
jgi:pyruvate dehydrogenase E2 component (dihydrolipoamide acetyltransferase)